MHFSLILTTITTLSIIISPQPQLRNRKVNISIPRLTTWNCYFPNRERQKRHTTSSFRQCTVGRCGNLFWEGKAQPLTCTTMWKCYTRQFNNIARRYEDVNGIEKYRQSKPGPCLTFSVSTFLHNVHALCHKLRCKLQNWQNWNWPL
jgi:hypothetical protein